MIDRLHLPAPPGVACSQNTHIYAKKKKHGPHTAITAFFYRNQAECLCYYGAGVGFVDSAREENTEGGGVQNKARAEVEI